MNAAQRRKVEELKAQLVEAQAEGQRLLRQGDPDYDLRRKAAERNGWLVDLGTGPFTPDITDDMLIEVIRRRRAEAAGMSYEAYMALTEEERVALFPARERPMVRREWRYSDRRTDDET